MNRALVLFAHPLAESFSAAVHRTAVETLQRNGWQVDDCDLYGEGFDPVLSPDERRHYHDEAVNTVPVAGHVERLRAAEALVLVFPVWNFGYPAILKGYLDRVFLPGVSFGMTDGRVGGCLHNIRRLAAVTHYGTTRLRAAVLGDPPRRSVTRHLRAVVHPRAKTRYLALYDMNRADDVRRRAFLGRVTRQMESF
ncbi:flavodoxin family protein [Rhodobacteraceae bacterium 2CG4]|uniref:Flavodoxin family protein n=1 Tax=Halovulum marinum TaxID=2662447 RepID=A0A6L5YY27_9RHOB|nr:NAD(P)H-dependent oxidoreductase [Halovulum marinum]MSU89167.1 flavodoxin family protein [Halovulum marinum]